MIVPKIPRNQENHLRNLWKRGELNQESPLGTGDSSLHDFAVDMSHLRINAHNHPPCSSCGCNGSSISLRSVATAFASPGPPSELNPKNFFGENLSAFSKIPLPIIEPSPPLGRCISGPCTPPRSAVAAPPLDSVAVQTPPEGQRILASSSSLLPKPPVLRRSVSDPTSSPAKSLSRANYESPNIKGKGEAKESHETVSVDKVGDCIKIRFKCPCKQGFKVLLFGGDLYYRIL